MRRLLYVPLVAATLALVPAIPAGAADTECTGVLTGSHDNVVVPENAVCQLNGAQVSGNVKVLNGGALHVGGGTTVQGNVDADQPLWVSIESGNTFNGNIQVKGVTSGPPSGAPFNGPRNRICSSTVRGSVEILESASAADWSLGVGESCAGTGLLIQAGSLKVEKNRGDMDIQQVTVGGSPTTPGPGGSLQANSNESVNLLSNVIRQNLQCKDNGSVTGEGNVARRKQDQCRVLEASTFQFSQNMHPLGASPRLVPTQNASPVDGIFNSDLTFWGNMAFQGTYEGFRIIDISEPDNPQEIINYADCSPASTQGNQGDVLVWDDILVRSWNSPATATSSCDGQLVGAGFEGLHVFDISDPADPTLVGAVPLAGLPNRVTVNPPSSAAGQYFASGAAFGPPPTAAGFGGAIVLVNDGVSTPPTGTPTDGCEPFTVPAGAIALIDRGSCTFVVKVANAQAAGAGAVIVANNVPGTPGTMGGTDPTITIPSVMVSLDDGNTIKAGLPASGTVSRNPAFGCGSHTATLVPDVQNGRVLVYNSSSAGGVCDFFEIVEVPLDDPGSAGIVNIVDSMHTCHDIGVILGDAMRMACSGGEGARIFSLDPADGASLDNPVLMHHFDIPGVTIGHSAAWTWDGEVLIFGHEPGGGSQARCQESSALVDRTLYFYDHEGNQLGTFVHPRPQTALENCTWHNYNVVPTGRRYVLVSGNYQSGISVVDFTDPAEAREIAFADPAPIVDPDPPVGIEGGGDWSSYWYNGRIYESDMLRGLIVWNLSDRAVAGAKMLDHQNPQTQEFTIG